MTTASTAIGKDATTLIYGASGYSLMIALAVTQESASLKTGVVGYVDDFVGDTGQTLDGVPVYLLETARSLHPQANFLISVGDPAARIRLAARVKALGGSFRPGSYTSGPSFHATSVGIGSVVQTPGYLGPLTVIGDHVHIMPMCAIAHDVEVGDFATICQSCTVSGHVVIEAGVFLGAGTTVVNGTRDAPLRIGAGAMVYAGSVVTTSLPAGGRFAGVPAREVGRGPAGRSEESR